jgi:hypothetical protein
LILTLSACSFATIATNALNQFTSTSPTQVIAGKITPISAPSPVQTVAPVLATGSTTHLDPVR